MRINETIVGEVNITVRDKATGEVVDSYTDRNRVVNAGIAAIWKRASTLDTGSGYQLETIHLGDDFGDPTRWSIFNPEPPTADFTGEDQNVVFKIPPETMTFEFPTDPAVRLRTIMDGQTLMDQHFPTLINLTFTSMTLRFKNGTVLSYKRLPLRSLSREVDVEVVWTITLENAEDFCANTP